MLATQIPVMRQSSILNLMEADQGDSSTRNYGVKINELSHGEGFGDKVTKIMNYK